MTLRQRLHADLETMLMLTTGSHAIGLDKRPSDIGR